MRIDFAVAVFYPGDHHWDIDFCGAYFFAQSTGDTQRREVAGFIHAVNFGCPGYANRSGVYVSKCMAADYAIGRADVHTGAAADAVECV